MKAHLFAYLILATLGCATGPDLPPVATGHPAHAETEPGPRPDMSGILESESGPVPPLPVDPTDPTPETPEVHAGPEPILPDVGSVGGLRAAGPNGMSAEQHGERP